MSKTRSRRLRPRLKPLSPSWVRARREINLSLDEHELRHGDELLALCRKPKCVLLNEIFRLQDQVKFLRADYGD